MCSSYRSESFLVDELDLDHEALLLRSKIADVIQDESVAKEIDGFTLLVASWVIRARWREIQRFVLEFKAS